MPGRRTQRYLQERSLVQLLSLQKGLGVSTLKLYAYLITYIQYMPEPLKIYHPNNLKKKLYIIKMYFPFLRNPNIPGYHYCS